MELASAIKRFGIVLSLLDSINKLYSFIILLPIPFPTWRSHAMFQPEPWGRQVNIHSRLIHAPMAESNPPSYDSLNLIR